MIIVVCVRCHKSPYGKTTVVKYAHKNGYDHIFMMLFASSGICTCVCVVFFLFFYDHLSSLEDRRRRRRLFVSTVHFIILYYYTQHTVYYYRYNYIRWPFSPLRLVLLSVLLTAPLEIPYREYTHRYIRFLLCWRQSRDKRVLNDSVRMHYDRYI